MTAVSVSPVDGIKVIFDGDVVGQRVLELDRRSVDRQDAGHLPASYARAVDPITAYDAGAVCPASDFHVCCSR